MSAMKECFEQYGSDYITTMERFVNNEALYLRLLGKLFSSNELRELESALESGEKEKAFQAAHTLKGVTGNLGLTPLYKAVCGLVEPLREGKEQADYPVLFQSVQAEFHRAQTFWQALKGCGPG